VDAGQPSDPPDTTCLMQRRERALWCPAY